MSRPFAQGGLMISSSTPSPTRGMIGAAFDTAYMQHMVQGHQKDVTEFQKQAQSGRIQR
jgi:predicted outer membrane protein